MSLIEELVNRNNVLTERNIQALLELKIAIDRLPQGVQVDYVKRMGDYASGVLTDYGTPREFDLTTARDAVEITGMAGEQLLARSTTSDLDGVGVSLNRQDAPIIWFNDSNPILFHFDKLYLTNSAFSSGTLKLLTSFTHTYVPVMTSTPPVLSTSQKKFSELIEYRHTDGDPIEGRTCTSVAAYTVPAGWKLFIGGAVITCDASCLQKVVMTHTPGIIGDYMYDVKGELMFTNISSTILDPGDVLTIYIYNNDVEYRDFSVTITGVLEALEV